MADQILSALFKLILVLSGMLLCSSGLGLIVDLSVLPMEQLRLYAGSGVVVLSLALAGANLLLARHPFYEYWMVVTAGIFIGVYYVT